jgi:hypothetical protein
MTSPRAVKKPDNYAAFYGLLNRMYAPDKEELKKAIVLEYTSGRTDSLKDMKMAEYLSALKGMQRLVVPTSQEDEQKVIKKKRSDVLHQMQLIGIDTADWNKINAFCTDTRIVGKVFRELNGEELDALLVKLRIIRRKKETINV